MEDRHFRHPQRAPCKRSRPGAQLTVVLPPQPLVNEYRGARAVAGSFGSPG